MTEALRPLRPLQASSQPDHSPGPTPSPISVSAPDPLQKRAICSQCRIRKVRCDGRPNTCQNCDRLGFECSFSSLSKLGQYVVKLPERRRRMQACIPCHSKKTRCLGELPSCSSCVRRNRVCVYPNASRAKKHGSTAEGTRSDDKSTRDVSLGPEVGVGSAEGPALDHGTTMGLMEDYFRHLYPLPSFAFLHKPTVLQRCGDQTINETLKLAICAITALQLQRTSLCHDIWVQQAEQSILQQIGRASIFNLQALLLVIRYRIESGEFPTAFMLAALAARTALALRLNYERPELSDVAQEARRRLFWALYLLDDFFCVGLREFELCPEETIHLQLPCHEDYFEAGRSLRTGLLRPEPGLSDGSTFLGLRGVFLRLTSVRRAVMRFNRRVGLGDELSSTISGSIQRFEEELRLLNASLEPLDQYSVSNLTACRWQAQFLMLHMSLHQCHCDLYRLGLDGYSEAAPSPVLVAIHPRDRIAMQSKCLDHAESIIRIVSDFSNHGDRDCLLERDAAVCAFESARLVMFGSRIPGSISSLDVAINKAKLSLSLITRFFPYSASTQPLRKDLERLIASYSVRLALQTQETFSEPDPPSARPSTKVSQYASARQRLSVQSLLLQSDFVDDSNEIAALPQEPETQSFTTNAQTTIQAAHVSGSGGETVIATNTPNATSSAVSRNQGWSTAGQVNPGSVQVPSFGLSLDAGQEDAGLIFNPWMGFTSTEDMYGVSTLRPSGLDDEF
ncbi:fungal-specific transcription factor domain-containing protein [Hypomontagnella monticulosa]|nr:fungal-specific transcription factor domain-containing protein [Hypomontagnella monticulosa]